MKIAILGVKDFPLGKRKLNDPKMDFLCEIFNPQKVTHISVEVVGEDGVGTADGIIALEAKKLDLIVNDLELIERKIEEGAEPKDIFQKARAALEKEEFLKDSKEADFKEALKIFPLLTLKPVILVKENDSDYGRMMLDIYRESGMICFFTAGPKEVRAWAIPKGISAHAAAGKIHSDIQQGFIKAEVIKFADFQQYPHPNEIKTRGLMKLQDKEYVVEDADVLSIRFNV